MNKLASIVAVTIFGLMMSASNDAHADWKIRIDNWGNPDKPDYWKTGDTIFINVFSTGGIQSFSAGSIPGPTGIANFDIVVPNRRMTLANAEWIAVGTSGRDLFVVDQIEIFDDNGNLYRAFGVDNLFGWCISADGNDGNDDTCGPARLARQWYRFFLHTGVTDPPR